MDKNFNDRFTIEWAPRLVEHAVTFPESESEKMQRHCAADLAQHLKNEGGFGPVTATKNEDDCLDVESANSTGFVMISSGPEFSAHLMPLEVEEIESLIMREARDL